jgi:stage III sporulation protein AG
MKISDYKKLFSNGRLKNAVIIVGIIGVVLIFLSSFIEIPSDNNHGVEEYRLELQDSLSDMLSKIEGVGSVSVLLTIENSAEGVYLDNNSTKTKDIEPVVRGVVVACDGGDEPEISERVYDAVTKALNISSAKVCVTKLTNQ